MKQKSPHESWRAFGIADKCQQGITGGQRPIEIESIYFSHSFGLGIKSIIFFTSHDRNSVATK